MRHVMVLPSPHGDELFLRLHGKKITKTETLPSPRGDELFLAPWKQWAELDALPSPRGDELFQQILTKTGIVASEKMNKIYIFERPTAEF